jgi:hypothetical protein
MTQWYPQTATVVTILWLQLSYFRGLTTSEINLGHNLEWPQMIVIVLGNRSLFVMGNIDMVLLTKLFLMLTKWHLRLIGHVCPLLTQHLDQIGML